jgi:hypothetical protein
LTLNQYESGNEELTVLPRHTKVMVANITIQGSLRWFVKKTGLKDATCCDLASDYPGILLKLALTPDTFSDYCNASEYCLHAYLFRKLLAKHI